MKKWPIAMQVYSIRDAASADFEGSMRRLKEQGYDGVELAGTYGRTAVEIKAVLDEIGLELVCAHTGIDVLEDDALLDDYAATGMKLICIPAFPLPTSEEELEAAIARIKNAAERCRERGMQLLYHNHASEFEKIGGKTILAHFFDSISPELLQVEPDVCWVRVGGDKPTDFIRRYAGRTPVIHLHDYSTEDGMEFRPVGYGEQDVPSILKACEDAGTRWIIVEQDDPGMGMDSMTCAGYSARYLRTF